MITQRPKLIIFASGTKYGGGSGFENLVTAQRNGKLRAEITAVTSNNENGGVREKADRLKINFIYFPGPFTADAYRNVVKNTETEYIALSGWLKLVIGLDPRKTFNIHPGPLPKFGGAGMYGIHVHEAVIKAYRAGEIKNSEISMHFVTAEYDKGPVFFRKKVEILPDDTAETLAKRANAAEHEYQPKITDLVVNGEISWDGLNPGSLKVPERYEFI